MAHQTEHTSKETRCGLIGYPVQGSRSPALFSAAYGGAAVYDLIEEPVFEAAWSRFLTESYQAVNVTAPFKENAFREVLEAVRQGAGTLDGPAVRTGAVNVVVRTQAGLEGYNTDFNGILLSVAESYFPGIVRPFLDTFGERFHIKVHQFVRDHLPGLFPEKPQALVVGLGGAGKAAAVAAAELGFETALMNRNAEKAHAFAAALPAYRFLPVPLADFTEAVKECDLVLYTLPVPLEGIATLSADDLVSRGGPGKRILEANYKTPAFDGTAQLKLCAADGEYLSGNRWLLYQALTGYGLMTGRRPDLDAMEKALKEITGSDGKSR